MVLTDTVGHVDGGDVGELVVGGFVSEEGLEGRGVLVLDNVAVNSLG